MVVTCPSTQIRAPSLTSTHCTHQIAHAFCYLFPVEYKVPLPLGDSVRVSLESVQEAPETPTVHKLHDNHWYHTNVIQVVFGCKG